MNDGNAQQHAASSGSKRTTWKRARLVCALCGLLTGCSPFSPHQYHCPTEPVYDQTGRIVPHRFSVAEACLAIQDEKIEACYKDVD